MAKKKKPKPESWYGQIWWFLWHDDSALSWVVNIVLAVILIKFIIYPGLGLILDTNFPVVAVVSGSMDHHGDNLDEWWSENKAFYLSQGITKDMFEEYPFSNGFNKGDLMVLVGIEPDEIEKGMVVVFMGGKNYPIIHRVVVLEEDHLETKGDANKLQFTPQTDPDHILDETNISYNAIVGKAVIRIPILGWIKIIFSIVLGWFGLSIG